MEISHENENHAVHETTNINNYEQESCEVENKPTTECAQPTPSSDKSMTKLFVGGLPKMADESVIAAYFCNFGAVLGVDLRRDPEGVSRGFAFVTFEDHEGVRTALNCYDQHCIGGKWIEVKTYSERKGGTALPAK